MGYWNCYQLWHYGWQIIWKLICLADVRAMKPIYPSPSPVTEGEYYTITTYPSLSNYSLDIRFDPDFRMEYTAVYWLRVVLLFAAILGNTLICLVFSMKHYHGNLHAMLYRILAVTITLIVIINDGLELLPVDITGRSLFAYNLTTCKIIGVLHFWLRALSIWFLVLIALERFIAVWFPFRTVHLNTKRRYCWMILGMSIIIFALYAPLYDTLGHTYDVTGGQSGYCIPFGHVNEHLLWYGVIFDYMNLMVSSLLPFFCIAALNTAIICGLLKSRTSLPKSFHKAHSEMRSCVIVLLLISFFTIVLSLPYPIFFITINCGCELATDQEMMIFGFIVPVCDSISHSMNIVLYCFSGRQFRQNLRQLVCCSPKDAPEWIMFVLNQ